MSHVHIKIRVTGLIYVRHDSFICDMTHVCATWLVYMWHDSFVCDMTHVCATWLVHVQRALLVSKWSWLPQGFFFLFWMILVVRSFRNNNIIVIGALTLTKEACDILSVYSPNCKGKRTQAKTGKNSVPFPTKLQVAQSINFGSRQKVICSHQMGECTRLRADWDCLSERDTLLQTATHEPHVSSVSGSGDELERSWAHVWLMCCSVLHGVFLRETLPIRVQSSCVAWECLS